MVRLVLEEGRTIASVNKEYNLGEGTVRSWIRQFEEECEKNPEIKETKDIYEENRILRKGNRLEQYRFIDQYHNEFGVRWLLARFHIYPNSYYNYRKNRKAGYLTDKEKKKQQILSIYGSLTLCLPLDFHNPLQHSPLRLIFLSNFCFFSVLFCTLVV